MISRYEYAGGVWIDLEQPTAEEIREISEEFSVNEQTERELIFPTPVPMVIADDAQQMTMLVIHFPSQGAEEGETKNLELDFIVGENFILTVRYEVVAPLHHLKKLLEAQQLVEGNADVTTDVLLEVLFAHLYTSMRDHTNHIAGNLERVEKEMFNGKERTTVRAISAISRQFLHTETALLNQEDVLREFLEDLEHYGYFGPSFHNRAQRILLERKRVARIVSTHRAVASEMRETNIAILGARQNEIVKTLTLITVVVLPLELIAFIFDMHLPGTPLLEHPNAFFIVMGIMVTTVILLASYFAKKRWIF
jgi:magnesium transporter